MVVGESRSLEYTPTWVVAVVCSVIVLISLFAERGLHRLGKCLKRNDQDALFEALQKLKEELMLLGFISLLLTVSQGLISRHMCIPAHLASIMLPCKLGGTRHSRGSEHKHEQFFQQSITNGRRLLSADASLDHCAHKGKVPLLSLEALHQLHIFIFVLAVVHVIFCATTMVLGGARIRQWKFWEDSIRREASATRSAHSTGARVGHHQFFTSHAMGYWRKSVVVSWMISFFKQFYGSVTKADYIALRSGFIREHCPARPEFDFHKYMLRTLEVDFKRIVGISWYLWLFVVVFLLLNIEGWHTYFWLSFLPLVLLLLVGAKLEHIITRLAEAAVESSTANQEAQTIVRPSDEHFWFQRPRLVLYLIHFILFQNSFEIAFFFWILCTYGFRSCIIEKLGFIIPRLIIGVIVQVLCSYSTLPLYVLVTQMGSMFKQGIFDANVHEAIEEWVEGGRRRGTQTENNKMTKESIEQAAHFAQKEDHQGISESVIGLSCPNNHNTTTQLSFS